MLKNEFNRIDHSSFSNPEEAISTVVHLEWTLDFDAKQLSGSATHSIVVIQECSVVKFDTSSLNISAVEINDHQATFKYVTQSKELGSCVGVDIPVCISCCSKHVESPYDICTG